MNGFAQAVRTRLKDASCLVDTIEKGRCNASLADAPHPHVIIDLDATGSPLGPTQAKCDFLFFSDPNLVVPIEIKDGDPRIVRATRQLQAGAKAAESLAPRQLATTCRPILVSKELRRHKQNQLKEARVQFRGRPEKLGHVVCGDPLTEAFGNI